MVVVGCSTWVEVVEVAASDPGETVDVLVGSVGETVAEAAAAAVEAGTADTVVEVKAVVVVLQLGRQREDCK